LVRDSHNHTEIPIEIVEKNFSHFCPYFSHFYEKNTGLTGQQCENFYATGIKISDAEWQSLSLKEMPFHPEWNYYLTPRYTI